jgi:hypothetical protein
MEKLSKSQRKKLRLKNKEMASVTGSEIDSQQSRSHLLAPQLPQPPPAIMTVSFQANPVQVVPKEAYDVAIQENIQLRNQLLILQEGEKTLQQTIRNGERTIEELTRENQELKAQIEILRSQLVALSQKVNSGALKSAISVFSIAIIDLLKGDKLMDQMSLHVRPIAQQLNVNRVSDCHYLVHEDDPNVKAYKKFILREKLRSMPEGVRDTFSVLYPGVIDEVVLYLNTYPPPLVSVGEVIQRQVEFWWT